MVDSAGQSRMKVGAGVGVVFGDDSRQRVSNSTAAPNCWVGRVLSVWPNGKASWGTGTLISDRHVLTAAHNVFDPTGTKSRARSAQFAAGLTRDLGGTVVTPYPPVNAEQIWVPEEYRLNGGSPPGTGLIPGVEVTHFLHDYAVITLATAVPDVPTPQIQCGWPADPATLPQSYPVAINGYSGDLDTDGDSQFTRVGRIAPNASHDFVMHSMSTFRGDSGSAILAALPSGGGWAVVGVHAGGASFTKGAGNFGPAMNEDNVDAIRSQTG